MQAKRSRSIRIIAASLALALSIGVAVAAADEFSSSPPEIYRATTGSDNLHDNGFDGTGTTVAIIDSGVADVPGLDGALIHQENISSAPAEGDQFGHGTFVAGLVHLTAPGAKIVSVKLSDANGAVDVTQVLAALQWVVVNKNRFSIDVVNLSFGNDSKQSAYTSPLNFAVQQAWDAGIVVVASAGNLGSAAGTVTKPGDDPLIVSVGASDDNGTGVRNDDAITSFGSRGPTQDGLAKPDLVAPGARVISLRAPGSTIDTLYPQARIGTDRFRGSGTSFAAPIVAGIAAQVLGADPTLEPDQVKYGLIAGASEISGDPAAMGAGTVRGMRALNLARTGRANVGRVRSTGRGSLDAARGSAIVDVRTSVRNSNGAVVSALASLRGNHTVEAPLPSTAPTLEPGESTVEALDSFNPDVFTEASQWGASQWGASQWGASQWGASQWGASQWGASQWGASQWWASQWG